jgi:hypothetical protein
MKTCENELDNNQWLGRFCRGKGAGLHTLSWNRRSVPHSEPPRLCRVSGREAGLTTAGGETLSKRWGTDYLLFYILIEKLSLIWRCHHCQRRAVKFRPMLGTQNLWEGWDHATPAVTWGLSFSSLIQKTALFSLLLWHTRRCLRHILPLILTGSHSVPSYNIQGDAENSYKDPNMYKDEGTRYQLDRSIKISPEPCVLASCRRWPMLIQGLWEQVST